MKEQIKSQNEKTFFELTQKYLKTCELEIERKNDLLQFVFKSKNEETEITVYCDPDEYTVCIGEHYHTHFDIYSTDKENEHDKFVDAGENAIGFIQAFMRNEIWLEVTFRNKKAIGAAICDENDSYSTIVPVGINIFGKKKEKKTFRWEQ